MKRKLTAVVVGASLAVFGAVPAMAADGQCVSKGVKALGGPTISAAARGQVLEGINAVPVIIKDHVFNNADVTEGLLGIIICE